MVLLTLANALTVLSGLLQASFEPSAATHTNPLDAMHHGALRPVAFELEAAE